MTKSSFPIHPSTGLHLFKRFLTAVVGSALFLSLCLSPSAYAANEHGLHEKLPEQATALPAPFDHIQVRDLLETGRFDEARPLITAYAENGDRIAQLWLGFIFAGGAAVEIDDDASDRWMAKAADTGSTIARAWLQQKAFPGASSLASDRLESRERELLPASLVIIETDQAGKATLSLHWENLQRWNEAALARGVPFSRYNLAQAALARGDTEAHVTLVRSAAEHGSLKAMNHLITCLQLGLFGVKADEEEAETWRLRAAEAGDADQQWALALKFLAGNDPSRTDYLAALPWLEKAAAQNHPKALTRLGLILRDGSAGASDDARARTLFLRAVELGHDDALVYAAHLLHHGRGGPRDSARAVELLRQGETRQNTWVLFHFGQALLEGWTGQPDREAGQKTWEHAASLGGLSAQTALAHLFYDDENPESLTRAFEYAEMAARAGDAWAQNRVGWMLLQGEGITADPSEAVGWFRLAADKGNPTAMTNLAYCYHFGHGVDRDEAQHLYWLRKSATGYDGVDRAATLGVLLRSATDEAAAQRLFTELHALTSSEDPAVSRQARVSTAAFLVYTSFPNLSKPAQGLAELKAMLPDQEARLELIDLASKRTTPDLLTHNDVSALAAEALKDGDLHQRIRLIRTLLLSKDPSLVPLGIRFYRQAVLENAQVKDLFEKSGPPSPSSKDASPENPEPATTPKRALSRRSTPSPKVPNVMRLACISGKATVRFLVTPQGTVSEVELLNATEPEFGEAARDAVLQWTFWPALEDSRPVPKRVQIPIMFNVEEELE
jgi:TonB family protein